MGCAGAPKALVGWPNADKGAAEAPKAEVG